MTPSPMDVLSLPTPLILLVHLHILDYPYANNIEYDQHVFNPRTRGLRERAKTMEDVAYFLVGKIEGKSVKMILPTYPCIQPSESLAFRTSVTKYLENLRHQSIYPSSALARVAAKSSSGLKSLDSSTAKSDVESVAWWWKDVVVRKSLLEECSGDKFERLMLSLSTHALMKAARSVPPDKMSTLLHTQPAIYTTSLARYQATRHAWTKSASLLLRSEHDLRLLRESLNGVKCSKYTSISTERLQALAESKLQSLLQDHWTGEEGRKTLFFFIGLAGLRSRASSHAVQMTSSTIQIELADPSSKPPTIPSHLPIAAAHHPAHLKRLRRPIFQQSKPKPKPNSADPSTADNLPPPVPVLSHAEIILAEQVDCEKRMHQTLIDALGRMKGIGDELGVKINGSAGSVSKAPPSTKSNLFWTPPLCADGSSSTSTRINIDFDPKPTRELMLSLGLEAEFDALEADDITVNVNEDALEKKIAEIRLSVLPPYPSLPDPGVERKAPTELKTVGKNRAVDSKMRIPAAQMKMPSSSSSSSRKHQPAAPTSSSSPTSVQVPTNPSSDEHTAARAPAPPSTPSMSPSKSSELRSIRRKSVRFSMARRRTGRPSMFRPFNDGLEDEVDRLVDETHDFPTDDEDTDTEGQTYHSPFKTPKPKSAKARTPINRIWTAGTPVSLYASGMKNSKLGLMEGTPKPRVSSNSALASLFVTEPEMGLPSLGSATLMEGEMEEGEEDDEEEESACYGQGVRDADATPRAARRTIPLPLPQRRKSSESDRLTSASSDDEGSVTEEEDEFDDYDDPPSMTLKDILLSADTSHFDLLELSSEDAGIGEGLLVEDASFVWD